MDYSQFKQLEFRRKFFKIFGAEINVTDPTTQNLVGFIKMKAWKLKEDVRLYTDKSMQQEVVSIKARSIIDFGATYDITDGPTGQQIFSMRRQGIKSTFVRDHWLLNDPNGQQFGDLIETSGNIAIFRRWIEVFPFGDIIGLAFMFVPQTYNVTVNQGGAPQIIGQITHRKNPFIVKIALDTSFAQVAVDSRINLSAVALLAVVDATKN